MLAGVQCVSTRLSHCLETVTLWLQGRIVGSKALDTHRQLFFSLCTCVSILWFPYLGFHTSVFSIYPSVCDKTTSLKLQLSQHKTKTRGIARAQQLAEYCVTRYGLLIMAYSSMPYVGMALEKNGGHIKSAQMTHLKCLCQISQRPP